MILTYTTLDDIRVKERLTAKPRETASKLHQKAVLIIQELIPLASVVEEIPVTLLSNKPYVFFDIYVPTNLLFVEVQGQQHYEYVPFLHGNKWSFTKSKKRDSLKRQWCEKNQFQYLELKYNEQELWKTQLSSKIFSNS